MSSFSGEHYKLDADAQKTYSTFLTKIRSDCQRIQLRLSVKLIDHLLSHITKGIRYQELGREVEVLQERITDEMEEYLFMFIPAERAGFYNQPELFGADVLKRLPTIQFDMTEAGNCYAAGRSTAVVFHLMRIMETGVQEFGTKLGVALANAKNWQNILDEVGKAIKTLNPKDPQTVAVSQVSANLYAVKVAWRNEVMHPKDTYTLGGSRQSHPSSQNICGKLSDCYLTSLLTIQAQEKIIQKVNKF